MLVKTQSVAMAVTIDLTEEEVALLSQAALRDSVSLEELIKSHILSSCKGVNTPGGEAEPESASA